MDYKSLNQQIGNIDIYLLDQILKGRFDGRKKILDAGCGEGRNLPYFVNNGLEVHGIDTNPQAIKMLQMMYKDQRDNFKVGSIEQLEYDDDYFGAIICSAVLHFASNKDHFMLMMEALSRTLKPTGNMFIRMACDVGLASHSGSDQGFTYLLTKPDLQEVLDAYNLQLMDPFKTVLVEDKRSMAVLMLEKGV
ncbi:MAG: class I SAM-dependent methyltransferase [Fulvivirga sp.]